MQVAVRQPNHPANFLRPSSQSRQQYAELIPQTSIRLRASSSHLDLGRAAQGSCGPLVSHSGKAHRAQCIMKKLFAPQPGRPKHAVLGSAMRVVKASEFPQSDATKFLDGRWFDCFFACLLVSLLACVCVCHPRNSKGTLKVTAAKQGAWRLFP